MPITVAMIEEKEFKTKVRGYDPVEVDEFLDDICDEMIVMQEEISNLQARLAQASRTQMYAQPAPQPQRDANAEASDSAQRLLARAQKMYDDTISEAKREADSIHDRRIRRADGRMRRPAQAGGGSAHLCALLPR